MKLISYLDGGERRFGVLRGSDIYRAFGNIYGDFVVGDKATPLLAVKVLPPSIPTKIVAVGKNYASHAAELDGEICDHPILFLKPTTTLIAAGEDIVLPRGVGRVDYEGELCFVIKKRAKNVSAADCNDYILGYSCLNDVTARDIQTLDGQWTRAKSYDGFCPVGPIIETDICPDSLDIKTLVNGVCVQSDSTASFLFSVPQVMEFITACMTLLPGDIVTTGTPCGIGALYDGDVVSVEIEGISTLTNSVRF